MAFLYPSSFPIDALPTQIKNTVEEVQTNIKAPVELIVASTISAISLACQRVINVRIPQAHVCPCSQYFVVIADSGERKTTVVELFAKPFREFEQQCLEKSQHDLIHFEAALLAWNTRNNAILAAIEKEAKKGGSSDEHDRRLHEHQLKRPQRPMTMKFLYEDVTPEALSVGLYENWPSAGVISDEAGSILNGRAIADLALFNKLWGGGAIHVDRRTSECFIVQDPRLTLLLMVQENIFRKFLDRRGDEARASGFFARCLIACPPSTQGTRFIDNQVTTWQYLPRFQARLMEILNSNISDMDQQITRLTLELSPEAQSRYIKAHNNIEADIFPGGYLSGVEDKAAKLPEIAVRMAALLHYFEGEQGDISLEMIERAMTICGWYLEEFKRIFASASTISLEEHDAQQLEQWLSYHLQKSGQWRFNRNFIRQFGPNCLRNRFRLDAALNFLAVHHRIALVRVGNRKWIDLNPNYFNVRRSCWQTSM